MIIKSLYFISSVYCPAHLSRSLSLQQVKTTFKNIFIDFNPLFLASNHSLRTLKTVKNIIKLRMKIQI